MTGTVRPLEANDIPRLAAIIDAVELFPGDELAGMVADRSDAIWLTLLEHEPIGMAYCIPEALTDGTWNLLAIAVAPSHQSFGQGTILLQALEDVVVQREGRLLVIDTSGGDDFVASRAFYLRGGYTEEARIRDFWAPGDDKVTYTKAVAPTPLLL